MWGRQLGHRSPCLGHPLTLATTKPVGLCFSSNLAQEGGFKLTLLLRLAPPRWELEHVDSLYQGTGGRERVNPKGNGLRKMTLSQATCCKAQFNCLLLVGCLPALGDSGLVSPNLSDLGSGRVRLRERRILPLASHKLGSPNSSPSLKPRLEDTLVHDFIYSLNKYCLR